MGAPIVLRRRLLEAALALLRETGDPAEVTVRRISVLRFLGIHGTVA